MYGQRLVCYLPIDSTEKEVKETPPEMDMK